MELKTKFGLNQIVYHINYNRKSYNETCECCFGDGFLKGKNNKQYDCPDCYGKGFITKYKEIEWMVNTPKTIGLVRTEIKSLKQTDIFSNVGVYDENSILTQNEYMCYETGIGSGVRYKEENLFATPEEAQAECDKRNNK